MAKKRGGIPWWEASTQVGSCEAVCVMVAEENVCGLCV